MPWRAKPRTSKLYSDSFGILILVRLQHTRMVNASKAPDSRHPNLGVDCLLDMKSLARLESR
jgi:hypothetical protein